MKAPTLDLEAALWLGGPLLASLALIVLGAWLRPHSGRRLAARALQFAGVAALVVSIGWILLAFRLEAIEHDSLDRAQSSGGALHIDDSPG